MHGSPGIAGWPASRRRTDETYEIPTTLPSYHQQHTSDNDASEASGLPPWNSNITPRKVHNHLPRASSPPAPRGSSATRRARYSSFRSMSPPLKSRSSPMRGRKPRRTLDSELGGGVPQQQHHTPPPHEHAPAPLQRPTVLEGLSYVKTLGVGAAGVLLFVEHRDGPRYTLKIGPEKGVLASDHRGQPEADHPSLVRQTSSLLPWRQVSRVLREDMQMEHTVVGVVASLCDASGSSQVWCALVESTEESLEDYIAGTRRAAAPVFEMVDLTVQLLGCVMGLHDAGRLHGDIRPANLFLTHDGAAVKLAAFGRHRVNHGARTSVFATYTQRIEWDLRCVACTLLLLWSSRGSAYVGEGAWQAVAQLTDRMLDDRDHPATKRRPLAALVENFPLDEECPAAVRRAIRGLAQEGEGDKHMMCEDALHTIATCEDRKVDDDVRRAAGGLLESRPMWSSRLRVLEERLQAVATQGDRCRKDWEERLGALLTAEQARALVDEVTASQREVSQQADRLAVQVGVLEGECAELQAAGAKLEGGQRRAEATADLAAKRVADLGNDMEDRDAQATRRMDELERSYQRKLETMMGGVEDQMRALRADLTHELDERSREHEARIDAMMREHGAAMDKAKAQAEQQRAQAIAQAEETRAQGERSLATLKSAFEKNYSSALAGSDPLSSPAPTAPPPSSSSTLAALSSAFPTPRPSASASLGFGASSSSRALAFDSTTTPRSSITGGGGVGGTSSSKFSGLRAALQNM